MAISVGTRIGTYEIVAPIGAGGMGEVYRARDTKLNRDVALKVLPPAVADDPDRLARFRREAQVLAALNHPHIAQIHGFEDSGSTHALVMELVEGPTLAERIAQGPLPAREVIAIARQIAEALEAAHDKGIVHRDLKPANVKIRDDGTVKVLDFGLAKAMDQLPESGTDLSNSPTLTARATQLGVILGTAAYMAPEQAKGRAVDKRADIWAFGVVIYEMLTGRRAFEGEDASDVLAAVLRQEMDWAALPPDTPPALARLLQRCLDRDPKRRLRDIGDARFELDAASVERPAASQAPPVPVRRSMAAVALPWIAAAIVAAGAVTWAWLRPSPAAGRRPVTRSQTLLKDAALFVSLSRDGTRLAYNLVSGPSATIALRLLDQFDAKVVPGSEGSAVPIFSPDGQWLAYNTLDQPRRIRRIPVTGGTSMPICEGDLFAGGEWTDDDTIVFSGPKGLLRVAAGGGTPEPLTTIDAAKRETSHTRPQMLPGGRRLLFTVTTGDSADFAVLDLSTRQYRTVAKGGDNGRYVPTGHLTYERGGTLFAQPFDLAKLTVSGTEVPVVEGISTLGPNNTADYSFAETGLLVYVASESNSQGTTLAWSDRKGATQVLPGQSKKLWGTGRLSPDGRRVANAISDSKSGSDIWIMDVDRGTPTRLTFGGNNDFPIWTPDGKRVVYSGATDGKFGLYAVAADASGKPELLLATDTPPQPDSMTPDGRTLVFERVGANKQRQLFVMTLPSGGVAAGSPGALHDASAAEFGAQISPDGRWVAYESQESGTREVYLQPFPGPGPKVRVSAQGGIRIRWSRDGRELYYWGAATNTGLIAVDISAAGVPGPPRELFQLLSGTSWDVTPDRNRFLVELTTNMGRTTIATVTDWFDELQRRAPAKK